MKIIATADYMGGQLVVREGPEGYEVGTVGVEYMNNMEIYQELEVAMAEFSVWLVELYSTAERG